jgi:hypothetical protein
MKNYIAISIIGLALSGCQPEVIEKVTFIERPAQAGNVARPAPKPAAVVGVWSGSSYGESITVKFGSNGSFILNNDAGSNSGSWASQGSGSYSLNIAGQSGRMVLLNPSTASLNIGGSTIELRR